MAKTAYLHNFVKIHSQRDDDAWAQPAGVTDRLWEVEDLMGPLDAVEAHRGLEER